MLFNHKQATEIRREARERFHVNYLLSVNIDPKTIKSNEFSGEYLTAIQYLFPADEHGGNVCPWSTPGCRAACLHTSGNPVFQATKDIGRARRKRLYYGDRELYTALLYLELDQQRERAACLFRKLAVRLNGLSDIAWEKTHPMMFRLFSDVQFYDYTKGVVRLRAPRPVNYDLTLSRSEENEADCMAWLADGGRVSVVFDIKRTKPLPNEYRGFPVADGDKHDLIFMQPAGCLGLRAKGKARKDETGFVVREF